jgi:hypothetical protein
MRVPREHQKLSRAASNGGPAVSTVPLSRTFGSLEQSRRPAARNKARLERAPVSGAIAIAWLRSRGGALT